MVLRKVFSSATLLLSALLLLITGASPVLAASSATSGHGNGLKISPVRNDLTIKPGEAQTIDMYVTNLTKGPADLKVVIDDFTAGTDETGIPNILLNGEKAPEHSLKDYISPIDNFTLNPKETKDVKANVSIPSGTSAGGYFGVVRFVPAPSNTNKNVNLTGSVGSLVLVTVPGNYKEQMSIESLDVRKMDSDTHKLGDPSVIYTNDNDLFGVVRFQNSGDVQEQPFGKLLLKKGGKTLGSYEINNTVPKGNVLPDSVRRFSVPLKDLHGMGKYTIEGNFGYGNKGQLLSAKTTFYIIPIGIIIALVILLILILLAIFMLPKTIKKYNRGVVNRAARNARR